MTSIIRGAAVAEPWATVAAEWRQRDDAHLRLLVTAGVDEATSHLEALRDTDRFRAEVDGSTDPHRDDGGAHVEGGPLTSAAVALFDLRDTPAHFASVAVLIYLQALIIWEESDDLRQVRALAVALDRATKVRPAPAEATAFVAAVVEMCWSLLEQLQVENGVFCSCPIAAAEHAERTLEAVDRAESQLALVVEDGDLAGLRYILAEDLRVTRTFFTELASMSDAVSAWIDDPRGSIGVLTAAIDAAAIAVVDLEPDVLASELHTHRVALERMRAAALEPQLHLAEGTIVYLYPFGLPEESAPELVTGLLDGGRRRPERLGGLRVEAVKAATVAGGWQQEVCLGLRNQAVLLELEELAIETTAATPAPGSRRALPRSETTITGLRPEVRLSTLGNHVLRIEGRMQDVELHSLDQAMRRIGRASGRERLRTAVGAPLPGGYLCDLAERIVAGLHEHLASEPARARSNRPRRMVPRVPDLVSAAHVLLSARSLVVRDDVPRPCSPSEVDRVLGAAVVLGAPRSSAGSFEWWLAQGVGAPVNVLKGKGRSDALMTCSSAATFVYAPDLADWQTTELDQMAEHVASVAGTLQAWGDHLGHYEVLVGSDLEAVETTGDPTVIRTRLRELAHDASRARLMLGQLRPANICRNAADRAILEALRDAAGVAALEQSVHDGLEVLGAQQGRLAAEADRMRADRDREAEERAARIERRQAGVQRRLDLWLAVVSIVGLASLADFLNNAHDVDGAILPWAELAIIVALVALTATLYVLRWRDASADDGETDRP